MKSYIFFFAFMFIAKAAIAQFNPDYQDPEDQEDSTRTEQPREPQRNEDDDIEYNPGFLERTYVGGNLGLSFGSNFFFFDVSPLAGYDLIPQVWSVGLGGTYRYQRWFGNNFDIYGGRAFTRINIGNTFFLHGEYEYLSYIPTTITSVGERLWDDNILAGGGIWFSKNERGGFYLSVLYALTTDVGSFYENNPLVISPGFVFYIR